MLSGPVRIGFVLANALLGALPCTLFFAWIERNMGLPWLPLELGWPWLEGSGWPLPVRALWDLGLFLAFGTIHSALAQPRAHALLRRAIPPQAVRATYLIVTGTSLLTLMGLWQSTGVIVWAAPWSAATSTAVSLPVFWALVSACMALLTRFGFLSFFGFAQLYWPVSRLERSEGTPTLIESGLYRHVRHPVYLLTLLAILAAPVLALDRVVLAAAVLAYLSFGIPIEERKLRTQFGPAYDSYRARVPALFPAIARARTPR